MTTTLAYAIQLADMLAVHDGAAAHVVNDDGHYMLASAPDIGVYWLPEQIIYTATEGTSIPLDVDFAPLGF